MKSLLFMLTFLFFNLASSVTYKSVFYGFNALQYYSWEDNFRDFSTFIEGDDYYTKLCNDAIEAVSGYVYQSLPDAKSKGYLSDFAENYEILEVGFEIDATIDISNVANKLTVLQGNIGITSPITNISMSLPYVIVIGKVRFIDSITFNTLFIDTDQCQVDNEITANNFISTRVDQLENSKINATNKIFQITNVDNITFHENDVSVGNVVLSNNLSLMVSPYVYKQRIIDFILPNDVTQPRSLKIYFDDLTMRQYIEIYYNTFNIYYYRENHHVRNSTIGFNFIGNWENVQNFDLKLYVSDIDKPFIDTSGIPRNINYTIENDPLFNLTTGYVQSDGFRARSVTSLILIAFLMVTMMIF